MMRIAVVLVALFVFAALLVVDTGGILGLIFSWAISGPAYRWMLLSALLAIVALYCVRRRQKRPRVSGRARTQITRSSRQPGVRRPQKPKLKDRRQKSVASRSTR
jgi:membrane protein implicated in regulation of membrane protease activity